MSADNWAVCPKCLAKAVAEQEALKVAAAEAYGTVPPEQWRQMTRAADAAVDVEALTTFREDYEISTYDTASDYEGVAAELFISYGGTCSKCRFTHQFRHEQRFYP